ncbi:acyltransferase [Oricola sp.]|uniref:acyltransferase family protein n=1 Tax=Oricola sp. TaxID=1979950 RepID=UPI0025E65E3C|nr:acyltransferase [Oricola sp.]MCI5074952.1 acyltransferase [Oricola sp.]
MRSVAGTNVLGNGIGMNEQVKLPGLVATRFYAAAMIVLFHVIGLAQIETPDLLSFIPAHFGTGVPLFYIVSAFALCVGYSDKLSSRDELSFFFHRRFFRIAPLFYVMMAVYFVFLYIRFGKITEPEMIASSLFFVFNIIPGHVSGFVWASWSIGVEMLFYAIFPLIMLAVTNTGRAFVFVLISCFIMTMWRQSFVGAPPEMVAFENYALAANIHFFATGVFCYFLWRSAAGRRQEPVLGIAAIAASLIGAVLLVRFANAILAGYGLPALDIVRAVVLGAFVLGMALNPIRLAVNRATIGMGETSYSLYLWHPLLISLLLSAGVYEAIEARAPNVMSSFLLCGLATFIALIPTAFLSYHTIERWGARMSRRRRPAAAR